MKDTARAIRNGGLVLVAAGVLALGYTGVLANTHRTTLSVGSLSLTAQEHKDYGVPAIVALVALLGGITLLRFDGRRLQGR